MVGRPPFSDPSVVAVAHLVEHRIVTPEVAGSRPVGHPIYLTNPVHRSRFEAPDLSYRQAGDLL
jgi:hypothetical protein